jgi:hypothetical protein
MKAERTPRYLLIVNKTMIFMLQLRALFAIGTHVVRVNYVNVRMRLRFQSFPKELGEQ